MTTYNATHQMAESPRVLTLPEDDIAAALTQLGEAVYQSPHNHVVRFADGSQMNPSGNRGFFSSRMGIERINPQNWQGSVVALGVCSECDPILDRICDSYLTTWDAAPNAGALSSAQVEAHIADTTYHFFTDSIWDSEPWLLEVYMVGTMPMMVGVVRGFVEALRQRKHEKRDSHPLLFVPKVANR